jgi:SAM-dependent methyltransferase
MNAESLDFTDDSFDVVCGTGILHHLDIGRAMSEVARILHKDGRAVFIEPLGHNFFINAYRRLTPRFRTEDEHPLLIKDLKMLSTYFGHVDIAYYYFFSILIIPFRNWKLFTLLSSMAEGLDRLIFRVPFMRRFAWQVLIELDQPVKEKS